MNTYKANPNKELEHFGVLPNARQSGKLEIQLRCLVRFFRMVIYELKSKTGLPWKQRWKAWRSGFTSNSWMVYKLAENDPELYVTDLRLSLQQYKVNGFFNPILGNKLVMSRLLQERNIAHPKVVSIILKGQILEQDADFLPGDSRTLERSLERYPRQVFRPTWSGSGQGVFFLSSEGGVLKLNGERISSQDVSALLSGLDRYLATEFQHQAAYARRIFPGTTNTLRIMTLWDARRGEAFIAAVSHRFGTSHSGLLDSFHSGRGGICATVDLENATLGQAVTQLPDGQMAWISNHPDTDEAIEGVVIPGFHQCAKAVLDAANHFPFCPLIGWDAVLTQDGYSIIEANTLPSFTVTQIHSPLLEDPRSRQFFQDWNLAPGN